MDATALPVEQTNFVQSILNFFRSFVNLLVYIVEQIGQKFNVNEFQFAYILVLLGAVFMVTPLFVDAESRPVRGISRGVPSRPNAQRRK